MCFNLDTFFFLIVGCAIWPRQGKLLFCVGALLGEKTLHLWEVSNLLLDPVKVLEKEFMLLSNEDDVNTMIYRLNNMFKVPFVKMPPGLRASQCAGKFKNFPRV